MKVTQYWRLLMFFIVSCLAVKNIHAQYDEKYRPQFHFSPKSGWIGDPDGFIYTEGVYHLFWWGHAISKDLVHWEEQPYPMKGGDRSFSYFSGSAVVDKNNTAGFGEKSMIAIFTMHRRGDSLPETQGLSISSDRVNFNLYDKNPVLDVRKIFFRDPQVFWYEPINKWVMVVTVPDIHKIHFYTSRNLKDWTYLSEFGDLGPRSAFWECPDLFEMNIEGEPGKKKWVLLIGQGPNRVQYFMGSFDGKSFRADEETKAYLNEGKGLPGKVFESFEGAGFGNWRVTGEAFGSLPDHADSVVRIGRADANSRSGGDAKKGSLTSAVFTITEPVINFLIAGGNHPDTTCINLLVENRIVRTSTGTNSDLLKWDGWDVSEYKGKRAVLQIVDNYSGPDKGYIRIDHILFSKVMQPKNLQHGLWLDYGPDFYATRSCRFPENPEHKPLFIGWMGNWDYANSVPSQWGRGFESVPRDIALKRFAEGIRLVQQPFSGLKQLRKDSVFFSDKTIKGTADVAEFKPGKNTYEIEAVFNTASRSAFGFNLLVGEGRKLVIRYDPATSSLTLDRTNCSDFTSNANFSNKFPTTAHAAVAPENNEIRLHFLVDESSIELFTNSGRTVLSMLTYPSPAQTGIQIFSENDSVKLKSFKAWPLKSIWNN